MTTKRRHHFVPKFYLKAFASAPDRINLCHLSTRRTIQDASLREQCYIHRFYGPTNEIEDQLAELEGTAAPVIRDICNSREPPTLATKAHATLLSFIGLQLLRTPTARQNIQRNCENMDAQVFGDYEPPPDSRLQRFSPIPEHEILRLQLNVVPQFVDGLSDLQIHLLHTDLLEGFITSDNPAVKYNSYCRGIRYWGSIGSHCRGLQILLPLSPRVLILLYDGVIYDVKGHASENSSKASRKEVERLNALQIISAENCIYFSNWSHARTMDSLVAASLKHKPNSTMKVNEAPMVGGDENTSVVHTWESQPEIPFPLPLSNLRWQAKKVPLKERVNLYRREWRDY